MRVILFGKGILMPRAFISTIALAFVLTLVEPAAAQDDFIRKIHYDDDEKATRAVSR